ncbi:protein hairless [Bactrocera oleae]|uniref:protein hairless n=1 Tax=Bactrocera oleae TaxID=104688 RepID=UPI0006B7ECE8|nr:protein hairless isoform X2 [Bactrocera oleae]XP_014088152.1 protein hairless isoform X2 [Bactrocera oleae]XP_014088155.1 protein hairless isoform X2 [Bactrocera oleae]XP_014088156.1 protein hairless isoform X2 [Bactrocera oleae]XP_036213304.1 protein hairless isoform X2 [Bactrocera oleae]XP_036213305.1 protein hairless isoform X2 [Bactrocera oleae]XP_036213306.1 protein hairless isoform X2 [Bactrocera oleae]XP_036213307.1 protein hairless isoform X2 [Bactrocera oleae]XP_036213308.1 prot
MATAAAALGSGCTPSLSAHLISGVVGSGVKVSNIGVIDCSTSSASVTLNNSSHALSDKDINNSKTEKLLVNRNGGSSNNDTATYNSSGSSGNIGGRLKFFKNGKVILELARSKEGSKNGWISVPRKVFRTPSATSSTVTPTLATSITCSKNESLASLSFSDDNSSIQSSPWQREHSWKQQSPRKSISDAMSFYYQRPKIVILTKTAFVIARRKHRRPYDTNLCSNGNFIFKSHEKMLKENQGFKALLKPSHQRDTKTINVNKDSDIKCKTWKDEIKYALINEEDCCSSSSTATLTGYEFTDDQMEAKTPTPSSISLPDSSCQNGKPFENKHTEEEQISATKENKLKAPENMNKVEYTDLISTMDESEGTEPTLNGNTSEVRTVNSQSDKVDFKDEHFCARDQRGDDKRHKNGKIRLKLSTIVQKLIDRMPLRLAQLSKQNQSIGPTNSFCSSTNTISQKVSPSNASTATRLVEYPQQHVSPRKRILREFEKVSLEDNSNSAGGKRSRAKNNASSSSSSPHHSIKSPNSRSNVSANSNIPSKISQSVSCGNSSIRSSSATYSKSETTESILTTTPTRLYSSYSIHSLLGGNACSSTIPSISLANTGPNTITNETTVLNSKGYHTKHQHVSPQTHYNDPSYLRAMLASPKSPEQCNMGCGGKSPSTSASKKRSPPYVSPLHDLHINSDIGILNSKTRYASEQSSNIDTTSTILLGSHLHSQNKGFYVPYMPLSKYVPPTSTSVPTDTTPSISPSSCGPLEARSPRHLSAFSRTSSPASISSAILVNQSSSCSIGNSRENSPPTPRTTSDSPRDTIPRTVPKKTAAIRRQFASPNVVALSIANPSSGERHSEEIYSTQDHQTPVSLVNTCSSGSHQLLRGSPNNNTVPSPLHHYYMYSPVASNDSSNQVPRSSPVSTSTFSIGPGGTNSSASSYIPSVLPTAYMNPYFALAALRQPQLWSHYGGMSLPLHLSSVAASASLRLSPPAFHTFAYNGVNAAMAAVVQQQQQVLASSALMHGHSQSNASTDHPTINPCGGRQVSMTERTTDLDAGAIANNATGLDLVPEEMSSSKKEHSSDVPLNLSKH